jgi:hypothetical protein
VSAALVVREIYFFESVVPLREGKVRFWGP